MLAHSFGPGEFSSKILMASLWPNKCDQYILRFFRRFPHPKWSFLRKTTEFWLLMKKRTFQCCSTGSPWARFVDVEVNQLFRKQVKETLIEHFTSIDIGKILTHKLSYFHNWLKYTVFVREVHFLFNLEFNWFQFNY